MRAITGWRFLLTIALPLVLASLGAVGLTYDLLIKVQTTSNEAEFSRNQQLVGDIVAEQRDELGRLASVNARWDAAAAATVGRIDPDWFKTTWSGAISPGSSYTMVAVIDANSGKVLTGRALGTALKEGADIFAGKGFSVARRQLPIDRDSIVQVTGFATTSAGPALVAIVPITSPSRNNLPNGRMLVFGRLFNGTYLANLQRQAMVADLHLVQGDVGEPSGVLLNDISGQRTVGLTWVNRDVGSQLTFTAWSKASAVLGFLVLVMAGIGAVCWRLIQQLLAKEQSASHNALHDHLTGLPNRMALLQEMRAALASDRQPFTLAFADLDGFKEVNDSYGHEFGDRLICMVARGIQGLTQQARLSSRMGGDEFIVMFSGPGCEDKAKTFAAHLIQLLQKPFDMEGRIASVGASIGIAHNDGTFDETESLRRSDIAMYKAKASGKNRYCVFDESFDRERDENLSIAAELKDIIARKELDVAYQPVISARTGLICGVEALTRWPSSSTRQVPADRFVAIAETSGLIDALGELMLRKACAGAKAWPELRLAVNISAVQLNNPLFVQNALAVLVQEGIAPNRVEFEITETSLIHDTERAKQVFVALQRAGIKVALDDFGTGFSSIGYLRTFNFDRIKIDKSIVNKVLSSPQELAIVQGTLLVARGLSADVTAEGVENAEEVSVLRLAGCTELQGFYFHKPMAATGISLLLERARHAQVPRTVIAG